MPKYLRVASMSFASVLTAICPAAADAGRAPEPPLHAPTHAEPAAPSAQEELAQGTRRGVDLAPIYREIATARGLSGDADGARHAFVLLLAVDPTFRLARTEADEVRGPYLEARGFWQTQQTRFGVTARVDAANRALVVTVIDPAGLSARVQLRARTSGDSSYVERVVPTAPELLLPLEHLTTTSSVDYAVALLDEHGNRLFEHGEAAEPLRISASAPEAPTGPPLAPTSANHAPARGYPIVAGLSFGLAAASLPVGIVSHVMREDLADSWNRADCDGAGDTRAERCGDEHTRLQRFERLAGALYGVSAVSLLTGIVMLVVPRREARVERTSTALSSLRCGGGPGQLGLQCQTHF